MKFEYGTRLSTEETGKPGDIDRWTAYLDGPEEYETGRTEDEAVGALILANYEALGERF
jgi:hypothetical protein